MKPSARNLLLALATGDAAAGGGAALAFSPPSTTRSSFVARRASSAGWSAAAARARVGARPLRASGAPQEAPADRPPPASSCPPNANVVLRPSDPSSSPKGGSEDGGDEPPFDSFAIGTPRVHRYVRDLDGTAPSETQAEYVMWYHGRCHSLNADDRALPPLSTGRIGRATSRNGLHWEKCPRGSASEEGPRGVSLGLNTESWWGFDTAHVGLGQVMLPMSTPAVLAEGGVYLMYYMGGTHEETFVSEYIDDPANVPDDATIKGMKLKIGVAMSQDGLTWGRVEGDDPTGAVVAPYDRDDPNMRGVPSMRDDRDDSLLNIEEELYCGWPEVVVHHTDDGDYKSGSMFGAGGGKKPPAFFMYYSTMLKETKEKAIGCAVSEDGFRWLKRGVVLRPSENDDELDAGGCARCTVVRKSAFNEEKGMWEDGPEGDGWVMYYEGVSKRDGKHRVMSAESDDGRSWTKTGMVLDVGDEGSDAWDCNGVGSPHILRLDDGARRMYYTGQAKDGSTAIGVAKCVGRGFERERVEIAFA